MIVEKHPLAFLRWNPQFSKQNNSIRYVSHQTDNRDSQDFQYFRDTTNSAFTNPIHRVNWDVIEAVRLSTKIPSQARRILKH